MTAVQKLSPQAYLEQERQSQNWHEYSQGEIYAMTWASAKHNLIEMNIGAALHAQLKQRPCRVYPSDLRVQVAEGYVYPDVVVVCGDSVFSGCDNLSNLKMISRFSH